MSNKSLDMAPFSIKKIKLSKFKLTALNVKLILDNNNSTMV